MRREKSITIPCSPEKQNRVVSAFSRPLNGFTAPFRLLKLRSPAPHHQQVRLGLGSRNREFVLFRLTRSRRRRNVLTDACTFGYRLSEISETSIVEIQGRLRPILIWTIHETTKIGRRLAGNLVHV